MGGMNPNITSLVAAIAGGMLPALAWLWFWRREDSKHPEPRRLIALAFLAGMCTVGLVVPLEQLVEVYIHNQTLLFTAWSAIEETLKLLVAAAVILWNKENDEPLDAVIYMVALALGFSAAENTLFILSPLAGSTLPQIVTTDDFRFIGATLVHILGSGTIGVALALAFYSKSFMRKVWFAFVGLILAIFLHSTFNFLILNTPQAYILRVFTLVWVGIIALLATLEYVKRMTPRKGR